VPREPQRFPLDDQVVADPRRLVPEPVAGDRLGVEQISIDGPPARRVQLVQPAVERGDLVEHPLESLARSAEGLRLRLPDLALGAAQPIGPAPVALARGAREIVAPQLHAGAPWARWYAAIRRCASVIEPNGAAPSLRERLLAQRIVPEEGDIVLLRRLDAPLRQALVAVPEAEIYRRRT